MLVCTVLPPGPIRFPMRSLRSALVLVLLTALGACTSARPVTVPPSDAPATIAPALATAASDRLQPYPVALPRAFTAAVERGTRTTTGQPGPNYWTQHARYAIEARLDPDQRRREGTGRIVYTHRNELHLEDAEAVIRPLLGAAEAS